MNLKGEIATLYFVVQCLYLIRWERKRERERERENVRKSERKRTK